jgi:methylglutaconyl-CoA hydratase
MSAILQVSRAGPVATVTLSRPEVHNALNPELIQALARAFQELGNAPETRVIVLAAAGRTFCAGADLNWMQASVAFGYEENVQDALQLARMLKTIYDCPKPVIARLHGSAYGGGLGLITVCDMAIALESAAFCFSETRLGLIPAVIAPFIFRRIGSETARRYFLTAEPISAVEARRIHLVAETAPSEEALDAQVSRWTTSLLENGPEALAAAKQLVAELDPPDLDRLVILAAGRIAERRASEEGQEGMRAFLEKRAPRWREEAG